MNKKYLLILSLIFISYKGIGQTVPDIIGTYDRSHHGDPQGAAKLFVLKDHKYVIVFFGGAQTGTWNIGNDNLVTFEPTVAKERFTIYGRHNKDLGDSTRIGFMDFTNEDTFIHFGDLGKEKPVMKKVFNDSPNCLSFPYLYKYKGVAPEISFVNKPYQREGDEVAVQDIYTFHEAKGAYISPLNYKEGEEYKKDDESFNRMYIIYAFKAIQPSAKVKKPYDIDQIPLFTVKCKEEN